MLKSIRNFFREDSVKKVLIVFIPVVVIFGSILLFFAYARAHNCEDYVYWSAQYINGNRVIEPGPFLGCRGGEGTCPPTYKLSGEPQLMYRFIEDSCVITDD